MAKSLGARIIGIGRSLPEKILTNHDLEKMVDTSDEWIVTRTGIKERRIADDSVSTAELGHIAALEAMANGGVKPSDIDLVLCATSTPDNTFPSTACGIQHKIGAKECPAFDISAACSGFTYGLKVADSFIRSGSAKNVILVASEIYSRMVDWTDRETCVLFGDGAAAALITSTDGESGIVASSIHADGAYGDLLIAGGFYHNSGDKKFNHLKMKGKETFKIAVKKMTEVAQKLLHDNGLSTEDISVVIPHQANVRIINAVGKSLAVPTEKVFSNVHKYGNTSAASVPLAIYDALHEGKLKKGDLALLVTFGGGLTWGATLIRW